MSKWPMRGQFRHLHFKTFPMTPRTPQCEVFWPFNSSSKFSGVPKDSKFPLLGVWASLSHLAQSGVATYLNKDIHMHLLTYTNTSSSLFVPRKKRLILLKLLRCENSKEAIMFFHRNIFFTTYKWKNLPSFTTTYTHNQCLFFKFMR
jgi:hypothetical protein